MNNQFNIGDIIQSNHWESINTIYYLIIDLSVSKQLYKVKNITYDLELYFNMNDNTHKNYEIVSKV